MDYWTECISTALDEAGIVATKEQIEIIVGAVEGGHENYGMAHGYDCIPSPLATELNEQKKRTADAEKRAKQERENFRLNVARRHGVHPSQVSIGDSGEASYYV